MSSSEAPPIRDVIDGEIVNRLLNYWTKGQYIEIGFFITFGMNNLTYTLVARISASDSSKDYVITRDITYIDFKRNGLKWMKQKYLDFSIEVLESIQERVFLKNRNRLATVQHLMILPLQQKP